MTLARVLSVRLVHRYYKLILHLHRKHTLHKPPVKKQTTGTSPSSKCVTYQRPYVQYTVSLKLRSVFHKQGETSCLCTQVGRRGVDVFALCLGHNYRSQTPPGCREIAVHPVQTSTNCSHSKQALPAYPVPSRSAMAGYTG